MTPVREIMSTELATVDPSTQLIEAARAMSAARAGSVLVIDGDTLVGIFTETVTPETTVAEALNQMLFGGFRHLPVMDGHSVVGVVSMRDLARNIAGGTGNHD